MSVRASLRTLHPDLLSPEFLNPEPSTLPPACSTGPDRLLGVFDLHWRRRNPEACGTNQGDLENGLVAF